MSEKREDKNISE